MQNHKESLKKVVFGLGIVAIMTIIIDSIALNAYPEQLFLDPTSISTWESLVMVGAAVMGVFFIASMLWVSDLEGERGRFSPGKKFTIAFGAVCFVLLFVEKIMADRVTEMLVNEQNIDRILGNMQFLFVLQLIYVVLIFLEIASLKKPDYSRKAKSH